MARHYINNEDTVDEVVFVDIEGEEYAVSVHRNDILKLEYNDVTVCFLRKDIPNLIKLLEEADRLL